MIHDLTLNIMKGVDSSYWLEHINGLKLDLKLMKATI